ncbi:MAG TPA: sulfite exporter TauE/SafE family protein [Steroidobacteraceae bacterium]|nr:sulfite exporter TauE/SafE family protein [Steroidobacteraceae bacterium]
MNAAKVGLLAALIVVNVAFVLGWVWAVRRSGKRERPTPGDIAIGLVTDFLDALGIGSYATTTALFKFRGSPADELIPGTLNVGHNAAAFLEMVLFVTAVTVEPLLLTCMVASATAGAWLGAGVVSRLPRRAIQRFMGVALLIAAVFFAMRNLGAFPQGGVAFGLEGWRFAIAVGVNFVLGALMCIGIGNYAPSMIVLSLLGMHPLAAFPIMMGSDGILQPVASLGFFRSGRFAHGPSLGLVLGGAVGVLVAFFIVKQLPLTTMRWLVIVVVVYAAVAMLRSARRTRDEAGTAVAAAE